MTPVEVDAPAVVAATLILAVLVGSAALWIARIQRSGPEVVAEEGVPAWKIGWTNFGIFVFALFMAIVLSQNLAAVALESRIEAAGGTLTPWLAVAAVLLLQLPMLAVFYLARTFYPGLYADPLNRRSLSPGRAARIALPYFVRTLPIVWIATLLWGKLLGTLRDIGLIDDFAPQELVALFAEGGDPVAMVTLVILAVGLAPVVEEIIFRGCLYRFLKSQTNRLPAQVICGVLFALLHANALSFVPLVLVGVFLARAYESAGNILAPIQYHACFNGFSLLMLFLVNNSSAVGG